jgi:hypothetical protein
MSDTPKNVRDSYKSRQIRLASTIGYYLEMFKIRTFVQPVRDDLRYYYYYFDPNEGSQTPRKVYECPILEEFFLFDANISKKSLSVIASGFVRIIMTFSYLTRRSDSVRISV